MGIFGLPACSLFNQEGPDATCADLGCGRINACQQGIIAQCEDGVHLKYHACEESDACTQAWQKKGQYKCTQEDTDCEGCRPDRLSCDDLGAGGGTSSSESSTSSG